MFLFCTNQVSKDFFSYMYIPHEKNNFLSRQRNERHILMEALNTRDTFFSVVYCERVNIEQRMINFLGESTVFCSPGKMQHAHVQVQCKKLKMTSHISASSKCMKKHVASCFLTSWFINYTHMCLFLLRISLLNIVLTFDIFRSQIETVNAKIMRKIFCMP